MGLSHDANRHVEVMSRRANLQTMLDAVLNEATARSGDTLAKDILERIWNSYHLPTLLTNFNIADIAREFFEEDKADMNLMALCTVWAYLELYIGNERNKLLQECVNSYGNIDLTENETYLLPDDALDEAKEALKSVSSEALNGLLSKREFKVILIYMMSWRPTND